MTDAKTPPLFFLPCVALPGRRAETVDLASAYLQAKLQEEHYYIELPKDAVAAMEKEQRNMFDARKKPVKYGADG